jgi:ribose transport system substrate-binding protein
LAAAQKVVAEARDPKVSVTKPVGKPIPKGKSLYIVGVPYQAGIRVDKAVEAAGKSLGWQVTTKLVSPGTATQEAAYAAALHARPDAVLAVGIFPTVGQLRALRGAGIAVLGVGARPSKYYNVQIRNPAWQHYQGKIAAAFAVSDAGGPTVVGMVNVLDIPAIVASHEGVAAALPEFCAECKLKTLDIAATSIGTDSTARITNWLRANPDVKYLFLPVDTVLTGLPAALRAAGIQKQKILSFFATEISVPFLQSGEAAAAIGTSDLATGWQAVDGLARVFTNQSPAVDEDPRGVPPILVVDKSVKEIPDGPADYQAAFTRLWGQ